MNDNFTVEIMVELPTVEQLIANAQFNTLMTNLMGESV